jgi:hypothetical protein
MDRKEAVLLLRELLEHHFIESSHASIQRSDIDDYNLILKSRNSLFLTAFMADKNLILHEDKEKGICRIVSPEPIETRL